MENGGFTSQSGKPSDEVERPRQPDQVTELGYQASATPAPSREARRADPDVGTDGQLVEAGYGHGV